MKVVEFKREISPLFWKEIVKTKDALKAMESLKDESNEATISKLRQCLSIYRKRNRKVSNTRDITFYFGPFFGTKSYHYVIEPKNHEDRYDDLTVRPLFNLADANALRGMQTQVPGGITFVNTQQIVRLNATANENVAPQAMATAAGVFNQQMVAAGLAHHAIVTGIDLEEGQVTIQHPDGEAIEFDDEAPPTPVAPAREFDSLEDLKSVLKKARKWLQDSRRNLRELSTYTVTRTIKGERVALTYRSLRNCPIREEKNYFIHFKKRQLAKHCFENKVPKTDEKHIGIELEICTKLESGKLAVLFAAQGLEKHVTIKEDGSLRAKRNHYAYEITALMKETEAKEIVGKICNILNMNVVDAYVNESCGFHLHVDMRKRKVDEAYRKLYKAQKFLIETQPVCRMEAKFCNRNEYSTINEQLTNGGGGQHGQPGRYYVINPHAYNQFRTLEIRSHSGTTDALKNGNWIDLIVGIVDGEYSTTAAQYGLLKTLKERAHLSDELVSYFKARMVKFKKYYNDNENTDLSIIKKSDNRGRGEMVGKKLTIEEVRATNIDALPEANGGNGMGNRQTV